MKEIPFTQFMMPSGRQVPQTIILEDDCAVKAGEIASCGCRLTAEMLTTGEVSFCVEDTHDGDYDIRICANGPQVPIVITEMLRAFDSTDFYKWKEKLKWAALEDAK